MPTKNTDLKETLLVYHKFRLFLIKFDHNKNKFLKDIQYLAYEFGNMGESTQFILEFFDLDKKYNSILMKSQKSKKFE